MHDYSRAVGAMVLEAIWTEGGLTAEELEAALGLTADAVSARLQALLDAGLVAGAETRTGAVIWHIPRESSPTIEAGPIGYEAPTVRRLSAEEVAALPPDLFPELPIGGWPEGNGGPVWRAQGPENTEEIPAEDLRQPAVTPDPALPTTPPASAPPPPAPTPEPPAAPGPGQGDEPEPLDDDLSGGDAHDDGEEDEEDDDEEEDEDTTCASTPLGDRTRPLFCDVEEGKYNARDVLGMCRVYPILLDHLDRTNTTQVYLVDRQLAHIALEMTREGMPVDMAERDRVGKHLREIRDRAIDQLRPLTESENRARFIEHLASYAAAKPRKKDATAGQAGADGTVHSIESAFMVRMVTRTAEIEKVLAKKGVNFGAKLQQAAMLRVAGVPLLKVTPKTGQPKISKETLEEVAHHAAARSMLEFILSAAAIRTFIEGKTDKKGESKGIVIDSDSRLRPDWSIHKITGRWGSSPNVQNWSKRAGGGVENLRRMICAPPGFKIVGADFAQLEARLIAALSQDEFLLGVFRRNEDIHGAFAGEGFPEWPKLAEIYADHKDQACGLPEKCAKCTTKAPSFKRGTCPCGAHYEEKCEFCLRRSKVRDITKNLEYGFFYGGQELALYHAVVKHFPDIKMDNIRHFMMAVGRKAPGVAAWRTEEYNRALKDGEIRSPILGRRQVFPMQRVEPTVIYNFKPQSGGADLWDLGAIEFARRWPQEPVRFGGRADVRLFHNGHDSMGILTREDLVEPVARDVKESWEREWHGVAFPLDLKVGERWSEV